MIIPSINRADFTAAAKDIRTAESFLPQVNGWVQLDISDGRFSATRSWGDPEEFAGLSTRLNVEVHLMMGQPEKVMLDWVRAGARRLIIPIQTIYRSSAVIKDVRRSKVEVMPSIDSSTPIGEIVPYIKQFDCVQVLAVPPGPSGQAFDAKTPERVEFLRGQSRGVKIEVDGGINPETAKLALDAGADMLVSGSYIFESDDPARAYEELNSLL